MADCPRILAVLAATLLAAAGVCRGQANFEPRRTIEEQVVAPSPQVAEMMCYEDAALNSCDGTATMSVPLFQWQAGDIDMSLSLNYRIGAFKTDERGSWLEFVYLADGTKLSMTRSSDVIAQPWPDILPVDSVIENPLRPRSPLVSFDTTHYVGSYETKRLIFYRLNLPDGYVSMADTVYHWYLTDYQGNISGVVNTATKELEQYQDYYPYGKPHETAVDGSDNRRKFGGKELITDKGYDAYDFEARPLTLTIPRFTQPDIMAEKFYPISIYAYCAGDPINHTDPTGNDYRVDITDDRIIISAIYYVLPEDYDMVNNAVVAINNQSNNFRVDLKDSESSLQVTFALKVEVVSVRDRQPVKGDLNIAVSGEENANAIMSVTPKDNNKNGSTTGGNYVEIYKEKDNVGTTMHEIGHTLGLLHSDEGIMTSEAQSPKRALEFTESNISDIISTPFKKNGRNKDTEGNYSGRGTLTNNSSYDSKTFKKGHFKVVKNGN